MKYADFIKGNEGFQYSVNLQYDLYNHLKIKGYIPTKKSVELLTKYLLNTKIKDSSKSTVLIGPYGKGKSHLLLVLLNILCNINEQDISQLVERVEKVDINCADLIKEMYGNKKYVPIILNSNSMDLNQSFLIALKKSLTRIGEDNIIPNTYFDSAISVIEGWKSYGDTYKRVERLIYEECKSSIELFINQLSKYNTTTYEIFRKIFKEITSGIDFNPMINTDIVKLYEEVNHILNNKYGYDGMIIIFDEFSKFIEASAVYNTSRELKILQDFAELANRSDEPQMHLICVTHKTVNEYISQIPQDKVDAWRAIEGRFNEVYFNSSSEQNYDLIANAIIKEQAKFDEYWKMHKDDYARYYDGSFSIYSNLYSEEEFQENIIQGCFPLSPYATYALPVVSEKVAQNERTLFTFLSKLDNNSLLDVIKNNKGEKELVTIDNLYEYFEPLFKKEVFNEKIHELWLKTDTALKYTDGELESAVIKALAIINIINDPKVFPATCDNIGKAIGVTKEVINDALKKLQVKNVLMIRKSNNTLDFIPISGVDVEGKINSLVEARLKNVNVSKILNELIELKYILPRKYNDKFKMVRYFNNIFMTVNELMAYDNAQLLFDEKGGDGLFINVICENIEEKESVREWLKSVNDDRVLLIIPKGLVLLRNSLARYIVINELLQDSELLLEDSVLESQLNMLMDDTVSYIKNQVSDLYDLEYSAKLFVNSSELTKINKIGLSDLAAQICSEYYSNSPIINNELVNKRYISSPILKARNTVVSMLLDDSYKDFNSNGNSVECTLFRTTLKNKGFLSGNIDMDIIPLLNEIKEFIGLAEKEELSFKMLYDNLLTNNKKIGAREGIIPVYITFILKNYMNEAIILVGDREKKEVPITYEIINNINNNPKEYYLKIEKGTKEKEEYVKSLEEIFEDYKVKNSNQGRYEDLVKAIQRWLQSLSKYAKTSQINVKSNNTIDKSTQKLRKELAKFDINSRQFIYNTLPRIFETEKLEQCIKKLKNSKIYLESRDNELLEVVKETTKNAFNKEYKGSVSSAAQTWLLRLSDEKVNHIYDITTNSVLEILKQKENNDDTLSHKLGYALTGLALEDWNDNSILIYGSEIKRVIDTIEEFEVACDKDGNEGLIKISFVSSDNQEDERTFDKVEISPIGSMLLNNLEEALDEFGDSIDDNEKRNVLIKMLEKLI